jgi:hypothetical protein
MGQRRQVLGREAGIKIPPLQLAFFAVDLTIMKRMVR